MSSTPNVGVSMLYTDLTAVAVTDLARALEERGFESLWFGEHTHLPVESTFPWLGSADLGELAMAGLARLGDPFVLLSMAAAVTSRLRLGTSVCLAAEYEPMGLAHTVATLDRMSNGRVELGIGYGFNVPEMENRGLDVGRRGAILREKVLAMKELWSKDVARFDGEFVRFTDSWAWPKPVQRPHPPLHLGVLTERRFDDLVEFCDGWIPQTMVLSEEDLRSRIGKLRRAAESAGRDPASIRITMLVPATGPAGGFNPFWKPDAEEFRKMCLTPADVEHYFSLGADRIVVTLDFADAEAMPPILDHLAEQVFG